MDGNWTNTKCHQQLFELLVNMGFQVVKEVKFGRFSVDCFLSELHIAVEADGSIWHGKKKLSNFDKKRDAELLNEFHLPVFHVKDTQLNTKLGREEIEKSLIEFISAQNKE